MAVFFFINDGRIRAASGSGIIKAGDYGIVGQAQQVIEEARTKADQIEMQAEAVYQSEKKRGYQDGLTKARYAMAEQIMATSIRSDRHIKLLKEQIVSLVMEICKKVLHDVEPWTLIMAQVEKALQGFRGSDLVTLKVNPALADTLNQKLSMFSVIGRGIDAIQVKAVPGLKEDELILESEMGIVEATLDVQLSAIENAFRKALELSE